MRTIKKYCGWLTPIISVVFLSSLAALAQEEAAILNGRVTDSGGGIVPGVRIEAVNVNTNVPYATQTNESGLYTLRSLPPGIYRLLVEKEGFSGITKPGVELHVADNVAINFALEVGSLTQSITIEEGAPLVNVMTSALSGLVQANELA